MIRPPKFTPPVGACDSHLHVYGDPAQFPSLQIHGREVESDFLDDYVAVRDALGLSRTEIIQVPYYDTENSSVLHSIAALGWHIQYRPTEQDLPELSERLLALPVDVVVDHIGSIPPEFGTDHPAFVALLRMLETGRCWLKLSAAYQLSKMGAPYYSDYQTFARALIPAAPERMICGTNWPHPKVDFMPDDADLLETLLDWADAEAMRHKVHVDNPARLYGFDAASEA